MNTWGKSQLADEAPGGHHEKQHFNGNPTFKLSTGGASAPWGTDDDAPLENSRHGMYKNKKPQHDHQSIQAMQHGKAHITPPNYIDPEHVDIHTLHPEQFPEEHPEGLSVPAAGYTAPHTEDYVYNPRVSDSSASYAQAHAEYEDPQRAEDTENALQNSMRRLLAAHRGVQAEADADPLGQSRRDENSSQSHTVANGKACPTHTHGAGLSSQTNGMPSTHNEAPHHWNNLSTGSDRRAAPYAINSGVTPERSGPAGQATLNYRTAAADHHAETHHFRDDARFRPTTASNRINAPFAYDT